MEYWNVGVMECLKQMLDPGCQIPDTRYWMLERIFYPVSGIRYQESGIRNPVSGIRYPVSRIQYPVSE